MNTRKCPACEHTKPIDEFLRFGIRHRTVCQECWDKCHRNGSDLKDFTPRDLIEELRKRAYRGKLHYTQITEVVI